MTKRGRWPAADDEELGDIGLAIMRPVGTARVRLVLDHLDEVDDHQAWPLVRGRWCVGYWIQLPSSSA